MSDQEVNLIKNLATLTNMFLGDLSDVEVSLMKQTMLPFMQCIQDSAPVKATTTENDHIRDVTASELFDYAFDMVMDPDTITAAVIGNEGLIIQEECTDDVD